MQPYETPSITVLGTVAELTQASGSHHVLDADFPAHTPHHELTFS